MPNMSRAIAEEERGARRRGFDAKPFSLDARKPKRPPQLRVIDSSHLSFSAFSVIAPSETEIIFGSTHGD